MLLPMSFNWQFISAAKPGSRAVRGGSYGDLRAVPHGASNTIHRSHLVTEGPGPWAPASSGYQEKADPRKAGCCSPLTDTDITIFQLASDPEPFNSPTKAASYHQGHSITKASIKHMAIGLKTINVSHASVPMHSLWT